MIRKVSQIIIVIIAVLILVAQSSAAFHSSKNSIMKVHPVPWKRNISIQFGVDGEPHLGGAGAVGDRWLREAPATPARVQLRPGAPVPLRRRHGGGGGPRLLPLRGRDGGYQRREGAHDRNTPPTWQRSWWGTAVRWSSRSTSSSIRI